MTLESSSVDSLLLAPCGTAKVWPSGMERCKCRKKSTGSGEMEKGKLALFLSLGED